MSEPRGSESVADGHRAPEPAVNVMYIDPHDLGEHLGCYGYAYGQSPNLDRLAGEGVRLSSFFATAPQCMASRSSALSGYFPEEVGVYCQNGPRPGALLMAEHFRRHGYATHLWNTLNIAMDPTDAGYEVARPMPQTAADIARVLGDQTDRPFFLHVGFGLVHRPFGQSFDPDLARRVAVPPVLPDTAATRADLASFYQNVRALDERVGLVLEGLEAAGLASSTLVVFTSDHGPALARHKHTLYDPGLRVAGLLRLPGVLPAGRVVDALTSNINTFPTVCELAGIPAPATRGVSMASLLRGDGGTGSGRIFAGVNYARRTQKLDYHPTRCVRTRRHKLIRNYVPEPFYLDSGWLARFEGSYDSIEAWPLFGQESPPVELYDLQADPWEMQNLAGRPEVADVQAQLEAALQSHLEETHDPVLQGPVPNPLGEPLKPQWAIEGGRYRLNYDRATEAGEDPFEAGTLRALS